MNNTKKHIALIIAFLMALTVVVPGMVFADTASAASASAALKRPTLTNHAAGSTSIKNTWSKVKGAKGYEVYRSTSSKGKYKKVKTVKSSKTVSWTNTKLKKNKKYYYKVRAYKTVKGKKKYSNFSSAKWAKPTNSPNPVFSMNGSSKTTSKVSVTITNKGRYSMVVNGSQDSMGLFFKNLTALKALDQVSDAGSEVAYLNKLISKGIYPAMGKKVTIKPGKTATISYTIVNAKAKAVKVKYSSSSFIYGEFSFNKKIYQFYSSKKYGADWE